MAKKILVVVDVQNDFVYGSLGSDEAVAAVPNIVKKVDEYRSNGDLIIFTQDTHYNNYLDTQEGKKLPVEHCIRGTNGWELIPEINLPDIKNNINIRTVLKETFGYNSWGFYINDLMAELDLMYTPIEIELIGLDTDVCVVSNALILKSSYPSVEITVDASCCAGSTPERHKAALEVMKSCQINVIGEGDE